MNTIKLSSYHCFLWLEYKTVTTRAWSCLKSCSTETSWLTKAFIMRVPFATENTHNINKWYESLWILQRKIKSHIIVKQIRIIEFCVDHWIVLCNMMKSRIFHGLSAVPHFSIQLPSFISLFASFDILQCRATCQSAYYWLTRQDHTIWLL